MKHITKDEALKLLIHGRPEPVANQCNKSLWWFVPRAVLGLWKQQPKRMALTNFIWLLFGLSYLRLGTLWGVLGFLLALFGLNIYYFYTYRKVYKAIKTFTYRMDEDGISLYITADDGTLIRYITTPYSQIKDIYLSKDYVYFELEETSEIGIIYLITEDTERVLGNIVSYMQLEEKQEIKNLPSVYANQELDEIKDFVIERFGKPTDIFRDTLNREQPIDIMVIPPTKTRNYWTLCTLGAGTYRVRNSEEYKLSKEGEEVLNCGEEHDSLIEHYEYVMYLPADWNLSAESLEKESNYWPIRVLNGIGHDTFDNFQFQLGDTMSFNAGDDTEVSFDPSTDFFGVLILCPLPDVPNETYANIGGRTIQFHQVMPITTEELDYLGHNSPADFMKKYMELDIIKLDEETLDVKEKQYTNALISHFERHKKGANVVTMYPTKK